MRVQPADFLSLSVYRNEMAKKSLDCNLRLKSDKVARIPNHLQSPEPARVGTSVNILITNDRVQSRVLAINLPLKAVTGPLWSPEVELRNGTHGAVACPEADDGNIDVPPRFNENEPVFLVRASGEGAG